MTPIHAHRVHLPLEEPEAESLLSTWLIGGAAIVVWFFFLVFLLPALVA